MRMLGANQPDNKKKGRIPKGRGQIDARDCET